MKKVEPLPKMNAKIDSKYIGLSMRSPFVTSENYIKNKYTSEISAKAPDTKRNKDYLESFDLKQLVMVGSLKKSDGSFWALVKDDVGRVHKVKTGSYIGSHYGIIEKVDEDSIQITETVENGMGGWQNNKVIMKLKN